MTPLQKYQSSGFIAQHKGSASCPKINQGATYPDKMSNNPSMSTKILSLFNTQRQQGIKAEKSSSKKKNKKKQNTCRSIKSFNKKSNSTVYDSEPKTSLPTENRNRGDSSITEFLTVIGSSDDDDMEDSSLAFH